MDLYLHLYIQVESVWMTVVHETEIWVEKEQETCVFLEIICNTHALLITSESENLFLISILAG